MNKQIDEMLHHGIIKESNSNWASPVVMCKKKGGQLRFCCDFRLLNIVSRPKFFPLPRLEDVFDSLGNAEASIFSTLDMMNGYWQIGLDPETAHKAAFVTPGGVYQWTRMPFGITSAPASFQHLLTQVLKGLNYQIALVEYPQHTDTVEEPEDVIPHVQLNAIQERHEPLETTFMYNGYPTKPKQSVEVITTDPGEDVMPQDIGKLQKDCPDFKDIYAYLHNGKIPDNKDKIQKTLAESNQYGLRDGVLYHFYQPRSRGKNKNDRFIKQLACPRSLQSNLMKAYHGIGHLGFDKTYWTMQQKYYFPGMYQKLADFIKHCDLCQRSKQPTHAKRVPLTSMPIMDTFSKLHIDMIGPFKKTNQCFQYVLIVVDSFSKWTEAFPTYTETSKEIAQLLYKEVFSRFGAPHSICSDRGRAFVGRLIGAVAAVFNVKQHFTSSYHPQTNSVAERTNKTIIQSIRTLIDDNQSDWPDLLPGVLMAFRMSPSATSEFSPFYLLFGKEMNIPMDVSLIPAENLNKDLSSHVQGILDNLKIAKEIATENIKRNLEIRQKQHYDKKNGITNISDRRQSPAALTKGTYRPLF
ncbi:unnamed protein product [Mytilus coruscus]|uniref:Integrase catalytic domain-containing protein n=1 Tax=Mytilus coruscus TaxID=42192 RepID=A0A6J8AMB6_MYTCO|nr:unnamed protein product [Mytilus coruscus]